MLRNCSSVLTRLLNGNNNNNNSEPPMVKGTYVNNVKIHGNVDNKKENYNFSNIIENVSVSDNFTQEGRFVLSKIDDVKYNADDKLIKERPDRPGVWVRQFNNNGSTSGWYLYLADTVNDNGHLLFYPKKIVNNIVEEYEGYYLENGYFKNVGSENITNPLQSPAVAFIEGKRQNSN